jgi:hypothetical protein
MGLPVGEVQTAYITLYRGDTTLRGLLTGAVSPSWNVFDADGVPIAQPFPYVVVQMITASLGTVFAMGTDATDVWVQVSVFTQTGPGGFTQARGIAKRVDLLTQMVSVTLANGFTNVGTLREMYQEIPERDGITQHIAQRYKAWVSG